MGNTQKKTFGFIPLGTILITYVIVKIIYKVTGFAYDFSDGIFNINLLIDVALWFLVYFTVDFLQRKLVYKKTD